ncbi:Flavinator of succinate dehydrogenase-domain-containing protein [Phascolomyces articulosus]|uniref:Succinate dehydrogenase assembly factor 2, mitochondrial n=1 Tax=Phascolomyces articulosus TaxID=60185 RepID=A0AAD5K347_9FUNG|nr:Flavinator of succinate dehydrogenase-domain-containing protein [Phascolomyces articulosus]
MSTQRKSQDPYPDLGIRHAPQMELDTPYPNLPPIPRPNEPLEKKRARLIYQSRKRGILETDLLLSTFAQKYLKEFSMEQLEKYDKLLDEPDWDIFYWATDKKSIPDYLKDNEVLDMVRQHAKNENKVVLRMPDLENGQ